MPKTGAKMTVNEVVAELRSMENQHNREGMARFGIATEVALWAAFDHALRNLGSHDILAVADLSAAVGAGEHRPIALAATRDRRWEGDHGDGHSQGGQPLTEGAF